MVGLVNLQRYSVKSWLNMDSL